MPHRGCNCALIFCLVLAASVAPHTRESRRISLPGGEKGEQGAECKYLYFLFELLKVDKSKDDQLLVTLEQISEYVFNFYCAEFLQDFLIQPIHIGLVQYKRRLLAAVVINLFVYALETLHRVVPRVLV